MQFSLAGGLLYSGRREGVNRGRVPECHTGAHTLGRILPLTASWSSCSLPSLCGQLKSFSGRHSPSVSYLPAAARAQNTNDADIRSVRHPAAGHCERPGIRPGKVLPLGHPEGLARDQAGNIYAATFDAGFQNYIYVYDEIGALSATVKVPDDDLPLGRAPLGMVTSVDEKYLFVNEVLNGDVLRYDLPLTDDSLPSFVYTSAAGSSSRSACPSGEFCGAERQRHRTRRTPLHLRQRRRAELRVHRRVPQGADLGARPRTGKASEWFKGLKGELDVRLASFPEFGVNGVAFSKDGESSTWRT